MEAVKTDNVIQDLLSEKCKTLENALSGEVIMIRAPMAPGIDDLVRREVEVLAAPSGRRDQLIVVLETVGGSVEVVERINDVFRHHFGSVVFVVPNFAYSAGTVLCLSGDDIYMDYYSVLGPIDPQIKNSEGRWVPGLGYLEKYNDLVKRSREGTTEEKRLTMAELEYMIRRFDPADLFALEQAKKHSADLVKKWLTDYKFKSWDVRESSGKPVTKEDKERRAGEIANLIGDATKWNSHGRGIPLRTLTSEQVRLKIQDFGATSDLDKAVREYYDLLVDYCGKTSNEFAIHTKNRFVPLGG